MQVSNFRNIDGDIQIMLEQIAPIYPENDFFF